jgi:ring-1,2-phenylacetyl-CoA epoxidase subunit PaaA
LAPDLQTCGIQIPDPDLRYDEVSGNWLHGEINWDEFWAVIKGNGPANAERMAARRKAHEDGQWVREAAAAYAEKHH